MGTYTFMYLPIAVYYMAISTKLFLAFEIFVLNIAKKMATELKPFNLSEVDEVAINKSDYFIQMV